MDNIWTLLSPHLKDKAKSFLCKSLDGGHLKESVIARLHVSSFQARVLCSFLERFLSSYFHLIKLEHFKRLMITK